MSKKKPKKPVNTRLPLWQIERDKMWNEISVEEQKGWQKMSDDAYGQEEIDYANHLNAPVSKDPEEMQK